MGDFHANGSSLSNALRGIKPFSGTKPDQFDDWYKKACFTLSIARPDVFHILEGQARPSTTTSGATESLEQRQAAYDRANQDLFAILYLITEKPAALLVTKHAEGARGTRGNGQKAVKELESKYLKITNETIRATQEALATTSMTSGQDPDNYINELTRLRNLLTEMEEPITDRHFTDIVLQGLTEEYRDVKLMTWKDPDFDLPKIQSVLRHLYLDGLSRNKTGRIAGRGTAMTATSATPDPSAIICHNCGKSGHYRSGCAVPAKAHGNSNKSARQKKKSGSGGSAGQKWCTVHRTTTHNDAECYAQGAPRSQTSSTHTAAVVGAQTRTDTDNKPVVNFDDDFDKGFAF